jgi:uncharacterized protein YcaQ
VIEAQIEGLRGPFYLRSQDREALDCTPSAPKAAILAPLDNLMWDRRYLQELFGFEYRWEVYKPAAERRWGYYVLPVLYGDRFVARFEPGRDHREQALTIANWWWEPGIDPSEELSAAVGACLSCFVRYLDRDTLYVDPALAEQARLNGVLDAFQDPTR